MAQRAASTDGPLANASIECIAPLVALAQDGTTAGQKEAAAFALRQAYPRPVAGHIQKCFKVKAQGST